MRLLAFFVYAFICFTSCVKPMPITPEQEAKLEQKIQSLLLDSTKLLRIDSDESRIAALAKLKVAEELSPKDPRVLDALGCVYWQQAKLETAYSYFKQAIDINPYYDRGYAHLALIAQERGEIVEAKKLYETAIQMNPLNYRTRNNYSLLLAAINKDPNLKFKANTEYLKASASRE